jgi:hypothetical protein
MQTLSNIYQFYILLCENPREFQVVFRGFQGFIILPALSIFYLPKGLRNNMGFQEARGVSSGFQVWNGEQIMFFLET